MKSNAPSPAPSSITQPDWEGVYYRMGLAESGLMESCAELGQLIEEQPLLASDPRLAAQVRTLHTVREALQAVLRDIVYPASEQQHRASEEEWGRALR
jgi:hypothetical protein